MESDPGVLAIGASEEAVVSSSVASVAALENTAVGLLPGGGLGGISLAIPLQQSNAVVGSPAVVGRVGDVGLAAKVECVLALLHGNSGLLPGLIGLGDDAEVSNRHVVGAELSDASRLVLDSSHAGVDKVVAPAVEAKDGTVNAPVVGELGTVGPRIPWGSSTWILISAYS